MENKDHLEQRCPRLGNLVSFRYCRMSGDNGQACFKIFDCWWEYFDVVSYFKTRLTEEQFEKLAQAKPKPKITSLIELIEQAKKAVSE